MKLIKSALATLSYLAYAPMVFAQTTIVSPVKEAKDANSLGNLFNTVFLWLIGIVGGLAIIFIVIGGIRYILAGGDPKATDAAKNQITAAIIGLVIALLSVAIVLIIGNVLGACTPLNQVGLGKSC